MTTKEDLLIKLIKTAREALSKEARQDCYLYDKTTRKDLTTCGVCSSCEARKYRRRITALGKHLRTPGIRRNY